MDVKWDLVAPALLFLIYISISVYFSKWLVASMVRLKMYYNLMAMFLAISMIVFNKSQVRKIVNSIIASGTAISLYLFINYNSLIISSSGRVTIKADNFGKVDPNGLAVYLCIALIFAIDKILNDFIKLSKVISLFCSCTIILGIFVTGSRGGTLSAVIGVTLFGLKYIFAFKKPKSNMIIRIITVSLIILMFFLTFSYFVPHDLKTRLDFNTWAADGGSNRTLIWQVTVDDLLDKYLLFGAGVGTFANLLYYHAGWYAAAHNIWLEIIIENGIIGLSLWLIFLAAIMRRPIKSKESTIVILLIAVFVAESFLSAEVSKHLWNALIMSTIYTKSIYIDDQS